MSGARAPGPEAGAAGAEPPGAALSVDVAGLLAQLARSFALLLPVYALGYLGLSFTWVLLALGLLVWCRRSRGLKATRLCRALALLEDEERAVHLGVRACDLPAWPTRPRWGVLTRGGTSAWVGAGVRPGPVYLAGPRRCRRAQPPDRSRLANSFGLAPSLRRAGPEQVRTGEALSALSCLGHVATPRCAVP
ncbi:hypothetical protein J1605_016032 [Eschrichtius robustus]|uniref:Extended synaptotagmin-3 n=1 Tax=Eschrichtius robustus TaxID=9764 RepID=A0AB34G9W2_ESCRO|nr:hypothetical protein J1605_016032 [Eschrichtius robustus]